MKQALILPFILISVISAIAQSAPPSLNKFPSYESVVQHFKSNYSTSFESKIQVQFARKPFGWYVELYDLTVQKGTPYESLLLWSYNRKQYQQLALKSSSKVDNPYWKPYEYDYFTNAFEVHPFFGYKNWSSDVCDLYASLPNLSDTLLYAVGRAYSNYAAQCLWSYDAYSTTSKYDTTFSRSDVSSDSVRVFIDRERQAISFFKQVCDKNPTFPTMVGNIYTKYSNEHLNAYLTLMVMGFENEANSFLPEGLYDEFIISTAKNFLVSCPLNSLLVTGGDNDTYPLLYVQATQSTRNDVVVTNSSLLNTARYIHFLRYKYKLALNLSDQQYMHLQNKVVMLSDTNPFVSAEDELMALATYTFKTQQDYVQLQAQNIMFVVNDFDENNKERLTTFTSSYKSTYLYAADVFLIDFIQNNIKTYALCFANTCMDYIYEPYNENLSSLGLIFQLHTNAELKNKLVINLRIEDLLLKVYEWRFTHRDNETFDKFISNYKLQFLSTAQSLLSQGDTAAVKRFTDRYMELFTSYVQSYRETEVLLLEVLIGSKQLEQANTTAETLLNEANRFIKTEMSRTWEVLPDEHGVSLWIYVCNIIKENAVIAPHLKVQAGIYYETLLPFYH